MYQNQKQEVLEESCLNRSTQQTHLLLTQIRPDDSGYDTDEYMVKSILCFYSVLSTIFYLIDKAQFFNSSTIYFTK